MVETLIISNVALSRNTEKTIDTDDEAQYWAKGFWSAIK